MAIKTLALFAESAWVIWVWPVVFIIIVGVVLLGIVGCLIEWLAARRRERVWAKYQPQPQRWEPLPRYEDAREQAERRVPTLRCKACDQVVASGAIHTCPVTLQRYDTTADDWSSFFVSLGVAYATDSTLLGGLAGGSLAGAMAGDLLRDGQFDLLPGDATPEPKPESFQLDPMETDATPDDAPMPETDVGSVDDAGSFDSGYSPD